MNIFLVEFSKNKWSAYIADNNNLNVICLANHPNFMEHWDVITDTTHPDSKAIYKTLFSEMGMEYDPKTDYGHFKGNRETVLQTLKTKTLPLILTYHRLIEFWHFNTKGLTSPSIIGSVMLNKK